MECFDYCISNPPYQTSTSSSDSNNTSTSNIFQDFYYRGMLSSSKTTMIFPGGRWMQRISRCRTIADMLFNTIDSVEWFPNGGERGIPQVFQNTTIRDGVSIVHTSNNPQETISYNGHIVPRPTGTEFYPLDRAEFEVVAHIMEHNHGNVNWRKFSRILFGLESNFVEKNPDKVSKNKTDFNNPVKGFLGNATSGSGKRVEEFWIDESSVKWTDKSRKVFKNWKVAGVEGSASKTPSAGGYKILPAFCVTGEASVVVGIFMTEQEAKNYLSYLETSFAKYLLDAGKGGKMEHWGTFLPDLSDWSDTNSQIDWTLPLDPQLAQMFTLSPEQIQLLSR